MEQHGLASADMPCFASLAEAVGCIFGKDRRIVRKQPVFGGDINEAYAVTLDDGSIFFLKSNRANALDNFLAEAYGLAAIAGTGTIRVPEVLGTGTDPEGCSFLMLEYAVQTEKIHRYWEVLAEELAALHRCRPEKVSEAFCISAQGSSASGELTPDDYVSGDAVSGNAALCSASFYGWPDDNYIGMTVQINTRKPDWITFFRECRLAPQFRMAEHFFDEKDRRQIFWLMEHLDQFLTEPAHPSLVHGDLWGGNVITGSDGKAWLIDPAAYLGHPEADLAMTELFGGFPQTFYRTYREAMGHDDSPGYEDRRDLYNLYHLLNHLNMFGGGYLGSVRRILRRYGR